jgi:hypothetical protein
MGAVALKDGADEDEYFGMVHFQSLLFFPSS